MLSYPSQLTVLQHMDPSRRIFLSLQCPALRNAEKSVPLKIKKFLLADQWFEINDTLYKLNVVPRGSPEAIDSCSNLDYGKDRYAITPRKGQFQSIPDELYMDYNHYDNEEGRKPYTFDATDNPNVIQLTVKSASFRATERLEYDRSVFDAMRYLIFKIFNRRCTMMTQLFGFICRGVHRLPKNFKVLCRSLRILHVDPGNLDFLMSLLDTGSFPLECLDIHMFSYTSIAEFPAKFVTMRGLIEDTPLFELVHSKIHFMTRDLIRDSEPILNMIRRWQERGRVMDIGTIYRFSYWYNRGFVELFAGVGNFPGVRFKEQENSRSLEFPRVAMLPLTDVADIHVYCEPRQKANRKMDLVVKVEAKTPLHILE